MTAASDDILDCSKIEAGMPTLEQTDYDPAAVVAEVRELLLESATAKGLNTSAAIERAPGTGDRALPAHA